MATTRLEVCVCASGMLGPRPGPRAFILLRGGAGHFTIASYMMDGGDTDAELRARRVWIERSNGDVELWALSHNPLNRACAALSADSGQIMISVVSDCGLWKMVSAESLRQHNPHLRLQITLDGVMDEPGARAWGRAATPSVAVQPADRHPPRTTEFVPTRKVFCREKCDVCGAAASVEYASGADCLFTVRLCPGCDNPELGRQTARNGAGGWRYLWGEPEVQVPALDAATG